MDTELQIYDLVRHVEAGEEFTGYVTGYGWDRDAYYFEVTARNGQVKKATGDMLQLVQHTEAPFEFGEVVLVQPNNPGLRSIAGSTVEVVGKSYNVTTGEWGFAVRTSDGNVWSCAANDLKPIMGLAHPPPSDIGNT